MAFTNLQQAGLYQNGELLQRTQVAVIGYCAPLYQGAAPPAGIDSAQLGRVKEIAKGLANNASKYAPIAVKELVRLVTLGQEAAEAQGASVFTFTQTQINTPGFTETLIPDTTLNAAMSGFFVVLVNDPNFTAQ